MLRHGYKRSQNKLILLMLVKCFKEENYRQGDSYFMFHRRGSFFCLYLKWISHWDHFLFYNNLTKKDQWIKWQSRPVMLQTEYTISYSLGSICTYYYTHLVWSYLTPDPLPDCLPGSLCCRFLGGEGIMPNTAGTHRGDVSWCGAVSVSARHQHPGGEGFSNNWLCHVITSG